MDTVYYYRDRYYGTWHTVRAGRDSQRTDWDAEPNNPNFVRIDPPDSSSPTEYLEKDTLVWRKPPARKMRWDREGIHFVLGLFVGAILVAGRRGVVPLPFAITVVAVWAFLFVVYEISEGWRIKDMAYRDVGAALSGFLVSAGSDVGSEYFIG